MDRDAALQSVAGANTGGLTSGANPLPRTLVCGRFSLFPDHLQGRFYRPARSALEIRFDIECTGANGLKTARQHLGHFLATLGDFRIFHQLRNIFLVADRFIANLNVKNPADQFDKSGLGQVFTDQVKYLPVRSIVDGEFCGSVSQFVNRDVTTLSVIRNVPVDADRFGFNDMREIFLQVEAGGL